MSQKVFPEEATLADGYRQNDRIQKTMTMTLIRLKNIMLIIKEDHSDDSHFLTSSDNSESLKGKRRNFLEIICDKLGCLFGEAGMVLPLNEVGIVFAPLNQTMTAGQLQTNGVPLHYYGRTGGGTGEVS
ncbi:hypothetical protein E2562_015599 [Oryza meyeriana var. granulata]|uniref:Uncharacterized protein n=1 Tax=Oryza meyeriana var. granulata TaxID=110450 RepID=A0A6G1EM00_9ORYZ|nr:hypothetical protein E2562_015599 [Oryza meyeriana var. granulata]